MDRQVRIYERAPLRFYTHRVSAVMDFYTSIGDRPCTHLNCNKLQILKKIKAHFCYRPKIALVGNRKLFQNWAEVLLLVRFCVLHGKGNCNLSKFRGKLLQDLVLVGLVDLDPFDCHFVSIHSACLVGRQIWTGNWTLLLVSGLSRIRLSIFVFNWYDGVSIRVGVTDAGEVGCVLRW